MCNCIAWSAEIISLKTLLVCCAVSLSLPFVQCPLDDDDDDNNYDELMMAMDQHSPGHDHLNDGICPAR